MSAYLAQVIIHPRGHHRRVDQPRGNAVDSYSIGAMIGGHGHRQSNHGSFRGSVGRTAVGPQSRYRRYINDATAITAFNHLGDGVFAAQDNALDVDRHHKVPVLFANLQHSASPGDTHIVVQDVQPPVTLHSRIHHAPAIISINHVALKHRRLAAFLPNHSQGLLSPLKHRVCQ